MDIKDAEEIIESGQQRPKKTFLVIIVFLLLVGVVAYVSGFFSEKAKKHANLKNDDQKVSLTPEIKQQKNSKSTQPESPPKINQSTEGDQSPAIISNDVNIIYGDQKDSKESGPRGPGF
ncbi:MAG: hypothetical protein MUO63_13055 [Desulfobulbaceae bacterium]|nr:hypothetical protein [Desulfobulbaceae bacterium]